MKNYYFNAGCALNIYKPDMEKRVIDFLTENFEDTLPHKVYCRHDPKLPHNSTIINVCAGCDKRFGSLYEGIDTISMWEVLDSLGSFPYPDYNGMKMSILDPCPVRERLAVHKAIRSLLKKMNIQVEEVKYHSEKSICCGDSLYQKAPLEVVHDAMKKRADDMPCEDVIVYCVSL